MTDAAEILQRRPPPPFPFTILTGFLGAGKTTLLNRLMQEPAFEATLVIINEFGATGLDHLLTETAGSDMTLMASGCICCTLRGDLIDTLEDILRRHDNGRMERFSRVILETTGLADPVPVLHMLMSHPYLRQRFQLGSVIVLVDAVNGMRTLDEHFEAVKQAATADRIVITKSDLLLSADERSQLAVLKVRLATLNPSAIILDSAAGEADAGSLASAGFYDLAGKSPQVRKWLNAEAFGAVLDQAAKAVQTPGRHEGRIKAFTLTAVHPVAPSGLQMFLDMLRQLHGEQLLRLKGIVALADDPARPLVIHGVQHLFHPPVRLADWPDSDRSTRIVLIVRDLAESHIQGLWSAFTASAAVDTADAEALTSNPLKPVPGGLFNHY